MISVICSGEILVVFFTGYACIPVHPVLFTGKLQGTSDSQGYPVHFTGKIFAVWVKYGILEKILR